MKIEIPDSAAITEKEVREFVWNSTRNEVERLISLVSYREEEQGRGAKLDRAIRLLTCLRDEVENV